MFRKVLFPTDLSETSFKALEVFGEINEMTIEDAIIVRVGIPYKEIVKVADEEDVNLIILSAHGKLGFSDEIMGSTTLRVIRKTNKPVLIIKTKL